MINLIKILHQVSNKLSEVTEEVQIYEIMNEGVKEIFPEVYFLITRLQPDNMNFRIIHSFGFNKSIYAIKSLLGKDPFQMDFPFSDLSEFDQSEFENRKLHHFSNGIYDLVNGEFNKTICRAIEKILGISKVYAISLVVEDDYYGGACLFIPKSSNNSGDLSLEKVLAIETIAAQASMVIKKLRHIDALKKKDEELLIYQSRFQELVTQMSDIVWKANGDGTEFIDLNNSCEKIYGYPSSEFVNNPNLWFEVVHPEDKIIVKNAATELYKKGNVKCEYRIQKPDGSINWLSDRKYVVFDVKGIPIQMGGVCSDITEKKLMEEQLQLKNNALDNSPNAVGMANLDGTVFYVNNSFVKLWHYNNKTELIGKHISDFSFKGKSSQDAFDIIKKGNVFTSEEEAVRKDGTTFNYIVSASLVTHKQKQLCITAVFTDITERIVQEKNQKENEVNLLKLNNDKDKFFSIISHDLRSPFNGMLGLLEILANNYYDYTDEERLKIIQASHNSAIKAFQLLTDLLEWARLQNNKIEIKKETISLNEVINKNTTLFRNEVEKKKISILNNVVPNIQLILDVNSLNTVIRNVLINAIKFTHNGGSIQFNLKQNKDEVELSIKDTGVGMTKDTIDKLFRLDEKITMPGTNNEKGTGLGLTICNDLIHINGWKMKIESELGNGTTITIIIPK